MRSITILKDEFIPSISVDLTEALSALIDGDYIYFLFPGMILKYNLTYNIFEEEVKIAESKYPLFLTFFRYSGDANI